jgi:hypothetical protein
MEGAVGLSAISIELFVARAAPYAPLLGEALGLVQRAVTAHVTLWEGAATVILHEAAGDLPAEHPFAAPLREGARRGVGAEICLEADDLEAVFAKAAGLAGFRVAAPLTRQPWGLRDFRLVTPDGYFLRIMDVRRGGVAQG